MAGARAGRTWDQRVQTPAGCFCGMAWKTLLLVLGFHCRPGGGVRRGPFAQRASRLLSRATISTRSVVWCAEPGRKGVQPPVAVQGLLDADELSAARAQHLAMLGVLESLPGLLVRPGPTSMYAEGVVLRGQFDQELLRGRGAYLASLETFYASQLSDFTPLRTYVTHWSYAIEGKGCIRVFWRGVFKPNTPLLMTPLQELPASGIADFKLNKDGLIYSHRVQLTSIAGQEMAPELVDQISAWVRFLVPQPGSTPRRAPSLVKLFDVVTGGSRGDTPRGQPASGQTPLPMNSTGSDPESGIPFPGSPAFDEYLGIHRSVVALVDMIDRMLATNGSATDEQLAGAFGVEVTLRGERGMLLAAGRPAFLQQLLWLRTMRQALAAAAAPGSPGGGGVDSATITGATVAWDEAQGGVREQRDGEAAVHTLSLDIAYESVLQPCAALPPEVVRLESSAILMLRVVTNAMSVDGVSSAGPPSRRWRGDDPAESTTTVVVSDIQVVATRVNGALLSAGLLPTLAAASASLGALDTPTGQHTAAPIPGLLAGLLALALDGVARGERRTTERAIQGASSAVADAVPPTTADARAARAFRVMGEVQAELVRIGNAIAAGDTTGAADLSALDEGVRTIGLLGEVLAINRSQLGVVLQVLQLSGALAARRWLEQRGGRSLIPLTNPVDAALGRAPPRPAGRRVGTGPNSATCAVGSFDDKAFEVTWILPLRGAQRADVHLRLAFKLSPGTGAVAEVAVLDFGLNGSPFLPEDVRDIGAWMGRLVAGGAAQRAGPGGMVSQPQVVAQVAERLLRVFDEAMGGAPEGPGGDVTGASPDVADSGRETSSGSALPSPIPDA